MRQAGSIAGRVFDEALAVLRTHPITPSNRRVPLEYRPPVWRGPTRPMTNSSPPDRTGGPLQAALIDQVEGEVSATELIERALVAIGRHADLGAMVATDAEGALRAAQAADDDRRRGNWRGPLHGIPVTVKDIIDVAGMATCGGSEAYRVMPRQDAVGVARLRSAGAIIVGKASTHEFALGVTTPQSHNPHDPARIPGGSSGGSAISVATGMALASLGTDTRASIRCPAALTGVVGLKPTYGCIPTEGTLSLSWTMDHLAPMAATVGDAAVVLDVLVGGASTLGGTGAASGLRIGVAEAAFSDCDATVLSAVRSALDRLAHAGFDLVALERPSSGDLDLSSAVGLIISRAEAAAAHRSLGLDRTRYWEEVADQLQLGESVSAVDYLDAQRRRSQLAEGLVRLFDEVDILAMPTAPVVAPFVQDFARYLSVLARNAIPWSLVGFPALSLPCHEPGDLPVGLQLVAPPGREDLIVGTGRVFEEISRAVS